MEARLQNIIEKLRQKDFRITPQRLAVLRILTASTAHPGADQVYQEVRKEFPTISLATVYKTANLLRELGELSELAMNDGTTRFDARDPEPHPHVICTRCLTILDFEAPPLDALSRAAAFSTGFRITGHRVDFFGLCPACRKNP